MIITARAYARAGLIGNPSDGYYGKTISFLIRNFHATVQIWESPHFEIVPGLGDGGRFDTLADFIRDQRLHGYYGGMRLIKAAIKRFSEFCRGANIKLRPANFTIAYRSDIPRLVGLAGSSAIVVATLRGLMAFYDVAIPQERLPSIALAAEKDELGIAAGLQDRVIQIYEGIVYMDFDRAHMDKYGFGLYERLNVPQAPPVYVAYDPRRAEVSDVSHRNLRALFDQGDHTVVSAMQRFRELTDHARAALVKGDWAELSKAMDENFDLRCTIMTVAPENMRMVAAARSTGASAKFAGSGGGIVGVYRDDRHFEQLAETLGAIGCTVIKPVFSENS